ncbi:MAG: PD-(D/E)XK nuclease family protein [Candidatus Pacebacteria bacterium]|nr:PD-(D/E)XK nuclease family protein [Candidatus Paceibacterota bacterium]
MALDKYSALWVSHTSISDFLGCPRAYYLRHMYRDPQTRHKIKIMSPALALGQAVHEVLESLSVLPQKTRFVEPLMDRYELAWKKVSGLKGGFFDRDSEYKYEERGREMIRRVKDHPGPVAQLAVKIKEDLPHFWISEEEGIILCGKVDWLQYLPESDTVHIIDFKTGKQDEDADSLQLPIYHLLVKHCQERTVSQASYWYLDRDDQPIEKPLPSLEEAKNRVLEIARQIKLARQLDRLQCPKGGCRNCRPFEEVIKGGGQKVGEDAYGYDIYIMPVQAAEVISTESVIL